MIRKPKIRKYHYAHLFRSDGSVSALCSNHPRRINLDKAFWTIRIEAVTCKKCFQIIQKQEKDNQLSFHPGVFINEELEARKWSEKHLAYLSGCSEQLVNDIISGKQRISSKMTKAFSNAFNVSEELFENLQNQIEEEKAPF